MKNEFRIVEFQDTVDSIDAISEMLQEVSNEEELFSIDYSKKPITAKVLPKSGSPMIVNIGEYVGVGGGAIKILSKTGLENILKIWS